MYMQMIAEIYGILRDGLKMSATEIGEVFGEWNRGRLNSYLIEITEKVLKAADPITGGPIVDLILDKAGQKGTGKWSAIEAQNMGVPATGIEAAVAARSISSMKEEREAAEKILGLPQGELKVADKAAFLKDLESALLASKIGAYAQGFAVMSAASKEFGWNLPMPTIARIWRAGCIIRSQFLDEITTAFTKDPDVAQPDRHSGLRHHGQGHRQRACAGSSRPPCLPVCRFRHWHRLSVISTAIVAGRGTANVIQAQRDFFGAHGFDRTDGKDAHHGPWGSGLNA